MTTVTTNVHRVVKIQMKRQTYPTFESVDFILTTSDGGQLTFSAFTHTRGLPVMWLPDEDLREEEKPA